MRIKMLALGAACSAALLATASANAAPVITAVGADISAANYTFSANGASFTFGFNGDYFGGGPVTVSSTNGGQINTIFGEPTTYFVDRGVVAFGPNMQYAAFATQTPIRFTNGDNFIGLRTVATNGDAYYGFVYTTNNILNSFGFERVANTAITATTAIAAVPEPTSWALMIGGFGIAGGAIRRRTTKVAFAA